MRKHTKSALDDRDEFSAVAASLKKESTNFTSEMSAARPSGERPIARNMTFSQLDENSDEDSDAKEIVEEDSSPEVFSKRAAKLSRKCKPS